VRATRRESQTRERDEGPNPDGACERGAEQTVGGGGGAWERETVGERVTEGASERVGMRDGECDSERKE
jgi:hypothetical protein